MRVTSWNVQGSRHKTELIQSMIDKNEIDILCIQEHWLESGSNLPFLNTIGITYDSLTGVRQRNSGRVGRGGIAILANNIITNNMSLVKIDKHYIHVKVKDINLINIYLPPSAEDGKLTEILTLIDEMEGKVIAVGDLNARLGTISGDTSTNQRGLIMLDHMAEASYELAEPMAKIATCISNLGSGIPDHVLLKGISIEGYRIQDEVPLISDHRPLTFETHQEYTNRIEYHRWNIRKFEIMDKRVEYNRILGELLEETVITNDIETAWTVLASKIRESMERTIGSIKVQPDRKIKIIENEKTRELLQELARISETLNTIPRATPLWTATTSRKSSLYKEYLDEMEKLKSQHFGTILGNYSLKQNRMALIKRISCRTKREQRSTKSLDPGKMDEHVEHFGKTFGKEPEQFHINGNENESGIESILDQTITKEDVADAIVQIAAGKAAGTDGIPPESYIYGSKCFEQLARLFTICLRQKKVPKEWKTALVCPVYKKGDSNLAENYRPIALTCVIRRIYEKCLNSKWIRKHQDQLADAQNGFRPNRSTIQQVMVLHELLGQNENAHVGLLDMKAAYDTVPRDVLWNKLHSQFGMAKWLIETLQELFDYNESILVIKGRKSTAIQNKRGLLQGSSLSPILFNFFINDLVRSLELLRGPKVYGRKTPVLAFADDIAVIARNTTELQEMIKTAENWSVSNGMKFNATKCIYLGNGNAPAIYNEEITKENTAKYLGIYFDHKGIVPQATIMERAKNANTRTNMLRKCGFNLRGLTLAASTAIYKTFIRPMLEYGICLFPQNNIKQLQLAQEHALRTMFSATRRTSRAALHVLTKIAPMLERKVIMMASFFGDLHNCNDKNIPAVEVYWRSIQSNTKKTSTIGKFLKNDELMKQMDLRNHWNCQLTRINPSKEPATAVTEQVRTLAKKLAAQTMIIEDNNIAMSLEETLEDEKRFIIETTKVDGKVKADVCRWLIGNICTHTECQKCHEELSRRHGIECAGIYQEIKRIFPEEAAQAENTERRKTVIDFILNNNRNNSDPNFYRLIARWVNIIQNLCYGINTRPVETLEEINYYPHTGTDPDSDSDPIENRENENRNRALADWDSNIEEFEQMWAEILETLENPDPAESTNNSNASNMITENDSTNENLIENQSNTENGQESNRIIQQPKDPSDPDEEAENQ